MFGPSRRPCGFPFSFVQNPKGDHPERACSPTGPWGTQADRMESRSALGRWSWSGLLKVSSRWLSMACWLLFTFLSLLREWLSKLIKTFERCSNRQQDDNRCLVVIWCLLFYWTNPRSERVRAWRQACAAKAASTSQEGPEELEDVDVGCVTGFGDQVFADVHAWKKNAKGRNHPSNVEVPTNQRNTTKEKLKGLESSSKPSAFKTFWRPKLLTATARPRISGVPRRGRKSFKRGTRTAKAAEVHWTWEKIIERIVRVYPLELGCSQSSINRCHEQLK